MLSGAGKDPFAVYVAVKYGEEDQLNRTDPNVVTTASNPVIAP
jgi:hypothetical protein